MDVGYAADVDIIRAGLGRAVPLTTGSIFVDAMGGWSSMDGLFGRLEGGIQVLPNVGVFGYGETRGGGLSTGVGARVVL